MPKCDIEEEFVVVDSQAAIAVFVNEFDEIVIWQEGDQFTDEKAIRINRHYVKPVIAALREHLKGSKK